MAYSITTGDGTRRKVQWLYDNTTRANIADLLSEEECDRIGQRAVYGYELDMQSREQWKEKAEDGLKIAMQVAETKSYPWPNCANVKHPLIAVAAIQFAARAYPNIVKGADVVKAMVVGEDPQGVKEARAKRVSQHMSWQLIEQMEEWEADTDRLLHSLPVIGVCYRKTYYDPLIGRNKSEFRTGLGVVVNDKAKDLETCRRVTDDQVWLYKNDVVERERGGLFVEGICDHLRGDEEEDPPHQFIEQHTFCDLDGDGYEEPYIVTVHLESGKVARIVARYDMNGVVLGKRGSVERISAVQYFTKYSFLPRPDGGYHDLGFAQLLGPLNETMNTLVNQLLDAGTLSNMQGGFIGKGIRWQSGAMRFSPGEWKPIDVPGGVLKDNIVPLPVRDPSSVLFQLLGSLTEMTDKLSSVSDAMSGEMPSQNTPATTVLAMIEQGLKVFTAIYKRVYRSLKSEYKKIYRLNGLHLQEAEYYRVLDAQGAVLKADYNGDDLDIVPVADPTISSEAQRLARSRAMLETIQLNPSKTGQLEILKRYYQGLDVPQIDKVLPEAEIRKMLAQPPPPNPDVMRLEAEILKNKHDYEIEMERLELEKLKITAEVELTRAQAIKAIAEAESKEAGQQFELYKHEVEQLARRVDQQIAIKEADTRAKAAQAKAAGESAGGNGSDIEDDAGGTGGMEGIPADQGGLPVPAGSPGGIPGATGVGPDGQPAIDGSNRPPNLAAVRSDIRDRLATGNPAPGA